MERTIGHHRLTAWQGALAAAVTLLVTGLVPPLAAADKGGVPHEGSHGKGVQQREAAEPAATAPQQAAAPKPAKPKKAKKPKQSKKAKAPQRHAPAAANPAPSAARPGKTT